jgi:hypothetical protein
MSNVDALVARPLILSPERNALGNLVAEMTDMRDRVEGLVVSELEAQGALMLQMLADMRDAGIASTAGTPEQLPGDHEEPT